MEVINLVDTPDKYKEINFISANENRKMLSKQSFNSFTVA